jgi:hypothetical protein
MANVIADACVEGAEMASARSKDRTEDGSVDE